MKDVTNNPRPVRSVNDLKKRSLIARAVAQVDTKGRPTGEYSVDFQYDLRDPENHFPNRSNPHLFSSNPTRRATHYVGLSEDQMRNIMRVVPPEDMHVGLETGHTVREFTLRGDLISIRSREGYPMLLVDTDGGISPSDFHWEPGMIDNQRSMEQRCERLGSMAMANATVPKQNKVQRPSSPFGLREVLENHQAALNKSYE